MTPPTKATAPPPSDPAPDPWQSPRPAFWMSVESPDREGGAFMSIEADVEQEEDKP